MLSASQKLFLAALLLFALLQFSSVYAIETNNEGKTYVVGSMISVGWQKPLFAEQEVDLYPGWTTPLNESIYQEMVPEVGSNFTRSRVLVLPGFRELITENTIWTMVFLPGNIVDKVTLYLVNSKPEIPDKSVTSQPSISTNAPIVNQGLTAELIPQTPVQKYSKQEVHIYPGWSNRLNASITQTMVPEIGSAFPASLSVQIIPGWGVYYNEIGLTALVQHQDFVERVTIYQYQKKPEIEVNKAILLSGEKGKTFTSVLLPPRTDKELAQEVHLYPGWTYPITHNIEQIMIPQQGSNLTAGKVKVYHDFQPHDINKGMVGIGFHPNATEGLTIYYDHTKDELPHK